MVRKYDLDETNALIAKANEKGFLVMYNHPVWSLQDARDYRQLKGIFAAEIFNYGSYLSGYEEDMSQCYQELLKEGLHIYPVASDDSHRHDDIGGGWVMVGAKELTYGAVIEALENGDFYASTGPAIHELSVDGDVLTVRCSDAATVNLVTHGRHAQRTFPKDAATMTEATFNLASWKKQISEDWQENAFFRICVTDATGKKAFSRAYWLKDLD